jgi:hypothetical protein
MTIELCFSVMAPVTTISTVSPNSSKVLRGFSFLPRSIAMCFLLQGL